MPHPDASPIDSGLASFVLVLRFALAVDVYELEAKKLANLMSWKPGDAIAEIGAGEGQMSFGAVILVGNAGHIYMTELDDKKISQFRDTQHLFVHDRSEARHWRRT